MLENSRETSTEQLPLLFQSLFMTAESEARKIPGKVEWGNWDKKIKQGQTVWETESQLVNGKTSSVLIKDTWEQMVYTSPPKPENT